MSRTGETEPGRIILSQWYPRPSISLNQPNFFILHRNSKLVSLPLDRWEGPRDPWRLVSFNQVMFDSVVSFSSGNRFHLFPTEYVRQHIDICPSRVPRHLSSDPEETEDSVSKGGRSPSLWRVIRWKTHTMVFLRYKPRPDSRSGTLK